MSEPVNIQIYNMPGNPAIKYKVFSAGAVQTSGHLKPNSGTSWVKVTAGIAEQQGGENIPNSLNIEIGPYIE